MKDKDGILANKDSDSGKRKSFVGNYWCTLAIKETANQKAASAWPCLVLKVFKCKEL